MAGAGAADTDRLLDLLLAGEERGLARAISVVEDERPGFEALLHAIHDRVGRARRVGITGPPGSGKSTLTAGLARAWRKRGLEVGIIAVDPTSPFTGGALLGDRVRMMELATEPGIFIRSMASRGSVGGLATSTREAADLMDAFGFDRILMETVGVGQSELDVAASADSTVVVLVPESGDAIQTLKAGLMEVADLFVVNKADRPGADRLANEIQVMLSIRRGRALRGVPGHHGHAAAKRDAGTGKAVDGAADGARSRAGRDAGGDDAADGSPWRPEVLRTTASTGEGVAELAEWLDRHAAWLEETGALTRRRRAAAVERTRAALLRRARRRALEAWEAARPSVEERLAAGEVTPYEAAAEMHARLLEGEDGPGPGAG